MSTVKGIPGKHGRFFHRATVNCSVETAWDIFTDHEGLTEFTQSETILLKEGYTERNGLGAVRELVVSELGDQNLREIVNYWVPHRLYGYHVIRPLPHQPSHHQGIVSFHERGDNRCEWTYCMRMIITPKMEELLPGVYDAFLSGFAELMRDFESECERRGQDIEIPAFPPSSEDEAIEYGL